LQLLELPATRAARALVNDRDPRSGQSSARVNALKSPPPLARFLLVGRIEDTVLKPRQKNELTPVTCFPFSCLGAASKKFIVRAVGA